MKTAAVLKLAAKIALLTLLMFVLFVIGTTFMDLGGAGGQMAEGEAAQMVEEGAQMAEGGGQMAEEQAALAGLALLIVCLVDTSILAAFILRSRLHGLRLIFVVAVVYYGVKTVMTQIETWYFMPNVDPTMLPGLFLMTVPVAILFPPIAVLVLGRLKPRTPPQEVTGTQLNLSPGQWAWKLALLACLIYPLLYFLFGYFVAWQNPELRTFYGGPEPGQFLSFFANLFRDNPALYPFQILRGLLWIGLALLIIRGEMGRPWETGLMVALLFSLIANDALIIPNPLMPSSVRLSHLIETIPSNFIWGWLIVWVLHYRHHSPARTSTDG